MSLSQHNSSVNIKDKITSKIRDCLSGHPSESFDEISMSFDTPLKNKTNDASSKTSIDVDDTVDVGSIEWHTPCDDLTEFDENYGPTKSPLLAGHSRVYKAIYPYKPTRPDEIIFEIGDLVILLSKTSERGWWYGEHQPTGKSGLFPANYVELQTKLEPKPSVAAAKPKPSADRLIQKGRLTALEHELAQLKLKIESTPSVQHVKSLEEEVVRLKEVTSAIQSPNPLGNSSPFCRTTPVQVESKYTASPCQILNGQKNPGPLKVPSCFTVNKTPNASSPVVTSSSKSATSHHLTSTSPASTLAIAVRVNAVATPSLPCVEKQEGSEFSDVSSVSKSASRRASVVAAGKLKRRSITHYTNKCKKNFSKLCNFYETLADGNRRGIVFDNVRECPSTSPSSLSSTNCFEDSSVSTLPPSVSFYDQNPTTNNTASSNKSRGKDNPFHSSDIDQSLVKGSPVKKRFPPYSAAASSQTKENSVAAVLLKHQEYIKKAASTTKSATQSPSLKNIRRPPTNKVKMGTATLSTPQPVTNVRTRQSRCSSASSRLQNTAPSSGQSVVEIRRRFEGIANQGNKTVTNSLLNSQPKEKRSRRSSNAGSASRRLLKFDQTKSENSGKDSGLGTYQTRQSIADSTVDIFNVAQTTQALEAGTSSCEVSPTSENVKKSPKMLTRKKMGNSGDGPRCSSGSMLNEAGIFDCSLTWTESSSDSADPSIKGTDIDSSFVKV